MSVNKHVCPFCFNRAELVKGDVIYPHRPNLFESNYYYCAKDSAWVGATEDGVPKGTLADYATRKARIAAHKAFDPLWKEKHFKSRSKAYRWLASELAIPMSECHIGLFDKVACRKVVKVVMKWKMDSLESA